jgi:cytidine deaminase
MNSMETQCVLNKIQPENLEDRDRTLLRRAHEAASAAYAPYSDFKVGSAIRLKNGEIVLGSNQENIAYPSGLCGERVALFSAGALYPNEEIDTIAIVSPSPIADESAFLPCGSCRQVLLESESRQTSHIRILLQARDESVLISESAINLMPFAFAVKSNSLKRKIN